ncbi:MAG: PAS domain-containing protein [Anaerolineae bacterium]|nr:PAS domain-containing protein [Anaerolineae bacterium]
MSDTPPDLTEFIEVVNHAVWLVGADLRFTAQNEAARKMMGWSTGEIVGCPLYKLVAPEHEILQKLASIIDQAMHQRCTLTFGDGLSLPRKTGGSVLVDGKVMPILHKGQAVGAMCAFWELHPGKDDTYLRYEFANMASHLFRTPLSYIQASIDFLMSSDLDVQERQAILSKMRTQSQRLAKYTNELLKLLRLENDDTISCIEPVMLLPLIERVLNLIQSEKPRHRFTLINSIELSTLTIAADPVKIELILLNLLLNGVRRCPSGGDIKVEIQNQDANVIISVADDGEFIPARQLRRVFWQFYPVDDELDKMPSTYNLGLYNTKRLVELQRGRIWAESYPGQYSQFSFSIPIWEHESNDKDIVDRS